MGVVTRITVPHRRWYRRYKHSDPALVVTKKFSRVMAHAGRCMNQGGWVEMTLTDGPLFTSSLNAATIYDMAEFILYWPDKDEEDGKRSIRAEEISDRKPRKDIAG